MCSQTLNEIRYFQAGPNFVIDPSLSIIGCLILLHYPLVTVSSVVAHFFSLFTDVHFEVHTCNL